MDEEIKVDEQNTQEEENITPENPVQEETQADTAEADVTAEAAQAAEDDEIIGNIKISVEVVTTIAEIAATEIQGVSSMYTSFVDGVAQRFGAKKSKGVKVDMNEGSVGIDLYIVVDYGVKIPELAWSVQESVKSNVESMTGLEVEKVNIHIEGINFNKTVPEDIDTDDLTE